MGEMRGRKLQMVDYTAFDSFCASVPITPCNDGVGRDIVFIADESGSMGPNVPLEYEYAQKLFCAFDPALGSSVAVVKFTDSVAELYPTGGVMAQPTFQQWLDALDNLISTRSSGGGTHQEKGINLGKTLLDTVSASGRTKVGFVMTDGDPSSGCSRIPSIVTASLAFKDGTPASDGTEDYNLIAIGIPNNNN